VAAALLLPSPSHNTRLLYKPWVAVDRIASRCTLISDNKLTLLLYCCVVAQVDEQNEDQVLFGPGREEQRDEKRLMVIFRWGQGVGSKLLNRCVYVECLCYC
jgi:hypothetical protein